MPNETIEVDSKDLVMLQLSILLLLNKRKNITSFSNLNSPGWILFVCLHDLNILGQPRFTALMAFWLFEFHIRATSRPLHSTKSLVPIYFYFFYFTLAATQPTSSVAITVRVVGYNLSPVAPWHFTIDKFQLRCSNHQNKFSKAWKQDTPNCEKIGKGSNAWLKKKPNRHTFCDI